MRFTNAKTGKFIEISNLAQFKRKCLFVGKGNKMWKVGSFNSEECAKEFEKTLSEMLKEKGMDNLWQY